MPTPGDLTTQTLHVGELDVVITATVLTTQPSSIRYDAVCGETEKTSVLTLAEDPDRTIAQLRGENDTFVTELAQKTAGEETSRLLAGQLFSTTGGSVGGSTPPNLTWNLPADNYTSTTGLVHFTATAVEVQGAPIKWVLLFDGVVVYETPSPGPTITTFDWTNSSPLSEGSHLITLQVSDVEDETASIDRHVSVELTPPITPATGLERGNWLQPGNAGNTGGSSTKPHGTYTITNLSNYTIFTIHPASGFDNYYFYQKLGAHNSATSFEWLGEIAFPTAADLDPKCRCLEWEMEQCIAGFSYNMAWQINFAGNSWRLFNIATRTWEESGVPFTGLRTAFAPTKFVSFRAEYTVNHTAKTTTHVALSINGTRYVINHTNPGVQRWGATSNYLNYAFQMDTQSNAAGYSVWCRNFKALYG